jgi:hypothetical protein
MKKGVVCHVAAKTPNHFGVFGKRFRKDVARAFERRLRVGDVGREIGLRQIVGDDGAVGKNRLSERPKAALTGDIRAGPPLRFVGQVEVFKLGFAIDRGNLCRQLFGRFALAANRSDDGFAARASSSRR